ncbi:MAG: formylglycine-generating enzyme family protein [Pirellulaceae bacterium]|nr:formylglycine-generating enzyme family protein [Pirellulaceae bacterium]
MPRSGSSMPLYCPQRLQGPRLYSMMRLGLILFFTSYMTIDLTAQDAGIEPAVPKVVVADSEATTEAVMRPYREKIRHSRAKIKMIPIPGGKFIMGSPDEEQGRADDEGPKHEVQLSPFWMSECEITWDAYEIFMLSTDQLRISVLEIETDARDDLADAISRPTKPYTDMTFGMGKRNYPACCMTQHAARVFCKWLSAKTGRYYRLPTEAEWEYACRAGTNSSYSFGAEASKIDEYAWYVKNSDDKYQKVRQKKPNPWGLYDMHGNVAEWVLDQYSETGYQLHEKINPLNIPETLFPRVVRGGSWENSAKGCRSAIRFASEEDWKEQDPQEPQSIWYHTEALWVGLRIVRPLENPTIEALKNKWDKSLPIQLDVKK